MPLFSVGAKQIKPLRRPSLTKYFQIDSQKGAYVDVVIQMHIAQFLVQMHEE